MHMSDSDAALVTAVQAGDAAALSVLYRRYVAMVFGYIRRRTPTTEAAEDVASETFLAVVARIRSFRNSSSFRTWMFQIARRRIADYWRRQYALPECAGDVVLALLGSDPDAVEPEEVRLSVSRADLDRVLAGLPERSRRVLECRFLEGKTVRETADALGLSEGNVKVIQHRAIRQAADSVQGL